MRSLLLASILAPILSVATDLLAQSPRPDAYLDETAARLVAGARAGGTEANADIDAYEMLAKQRISISLEAFRRDRLLFRREMASKVSWTREGGRRIEILGARMAIPIALPGVRPMDEGALRSDGFDLAIDPTGGDWLLRVPALDGDGDDEDDDSDEPADDARDPDAPAAQNAPDADEPDPADPETSGRQNRRGNANDREDEDPEIIHPLSRGSEEHYRFRSGETTTIRLTGGRTINLTELQVLPRRASPSLLKGSFWIDTDTNAPVRGVFSLAGPLRASLEINFGGPLDLSLGEASAMIHYVTVEYGLWENRWWLPRLVAFEGSASVGGITAPIVLEQSYGDYQIYSAARPFPGFEPPDTTQFQVLRRGCRDDADDCPERFILVPRDSSVLVESSEFPASIYASSGRLIGDRELAEVADMLSASTWRGITARMPFFYWNPVDGGLLHYNRVEGLTLGTSGGVDLQPLSGTAAVWIGTADLSPGFQVEFSRSRLHGVDRLGAYRRVDAFSPGDRPFSFGSSFSSFFFGRDDGDYYRSLGVGASTEQFIGSAGSVGLRAYAERQAALEKQTDVSVPNWLRDRIFRENPAADEADQLGGEASLRLDHGLDPTGFRAGLNLAVMAETGTFRFLRPAAAVFTTFPLPGRLLGAIDLSAGTAYGDLPIQRHWFVGGRGTVRGIDAAERVTGDTFWSARAEIGTELPAARIVLFGDAGWAGTRDTIDFDPLLISTGVGVSFLDGLIRADLAHPVRGGSGWALQLHLDAPL